MYAHILDLLIENANLGSSLSARSAVRSVLQTVEMSHERTELSVLRRHLDVLRRHVDDGSVDLPRVVRSSAWHRSGCWCGGLSI